MDTIYDILQMLEKIKIWPEPKDGAGAELGALAGGGMYIQYDQDRKKHQEQIEEIIEYIKNYEKIK